MNNFFALSAGILTISLLSACASTPEVAPKTVNVNPPQIEQTCVSVNLLQRHVTPAEVKSGMAITSIESPPEYVYNPETGKTDVFQAPPIERKEPWVRIIKPEETIYVDDTGKQVTDICEFKQETQSENPQSQDGQTAPMDGNAASVSAPKQ